VTGTPTTLHDFKYLHGAVRTSGTGTPDPLRQESSSVVWRYILHKHATSVGVIFYAAQKQQFNDNAMDGCMYVNYNLLIYFPASLSTYTEDRERK
jgi:hypothetical protein